MALSTDLRTGSEFVGYRIESVLGRGGMSVVYRAEDLALERNVALKLLAPQLAEDERFRARFQRESRLAASIDHPNVVPIYEAGEAQGRLFIAMRYVEGTDLRALLREEGPLSPERTLGLCGQVAKALDAAHAHGLIHRDIKPSNVLVSRQGDEQHCYLGDFGLTRSASERSGPPTEGQIEGTVDYLAPEVIEGEPAEAASDIYALGCLLYQCLVGEVPHHRESELATLWAHVHDEPPKPSERNPELPPELDDVIATALAKDPAERYATAGELYAAAIEALAIDEPETSRRRWLIAGVAVLLAAVLAAVLAVVFIGGDSGPSTTPTLDVGTNSIQRVDPETNELVATIAAPGFSVVEAGGGSVWAANEEANRIIRIDPETDRVVQTIEGIVAPQVLAYGADALWALNTVDGIVTRIDPSSGEVTRAITLPSGIGGAALGRTIVPSEHGVWLPWATPKANAVRIDPRSGAVQVVQIGPAWVLRAIDFVPLDESTLWVLGTTPVGGSVLKVDPGNPSVIDAEVKGLGYGRLAATPDGIWISRPYEPASSLQFHVTYIDAGTNRIAENVAVGAFPALIRTGAGALWVANWDDGTLSRLDLDSRKVVATIPVGPNPESLAASDDAVWVAVRPGAP